jgi:hypothetical protein
MGATSMKSFRSTGQSRSGGSLFSSSSKLESQGSRSSHGAHRRLTILMSSMLLSSSFCAGTAAPGLAAERLSCFGIVSLSLDRSRF